MAETTMDAVLDLDGAATELGISRKKLYAMLSNGEVPGHKVAGKWRFTRRELVRWVEKQPATKTPRPWVPGYSATRRRVRSAGR